jgi:hypothetical protein
VELFGPYFGNFPLKIAVLSVQNRKIFRLRRALLKIPFSLFAKNFQKKSHFIGNPILSREL